ncbi:MAG TPA: GNAT family N-acetyltransferase [Candidatus Stackebrandtia faecavium]|nr:GNAT family N-acetyltransferase [Candidatus Stackebrandtia faecavium]
MLSDQLQLRLIAPHDHEAVHSWGGNPKACRYQPWGPNTVAESRRFTAEAVAASRREPCTRRVYIAHIDGEAVGCGELRIRNRAHRQGEIQYIVRPQLWGRGIGTAIGRALLRIGLKDEGLHRIDATCDPDNTASAAILRKLGMSYQGRMPRVVRVDGHWRDRLGFTVLAHEHREAHQDLVAGPRDHVLHILHRRRSTGDHAGILTDVVSHRVRLLVLDARQLHISVRRDHSRLLVNVIVHQVRTDGDVVRRRVGGRSEILDDMCRSAIFWRVMPLHPRGLNMAGDPFALNRLGVAERILVAVGPRQCHAVAVRVP